MNRWTVLFAVMLILLFGAMGCSGGGSDPVAPTAGGDLTLQSESHGNTSHTVLWGVWDFHLDTVTGTLTAAPNRSAMWNANVVKFLNDDPTKMMFVMSNLTIGTTKVYVDIDVSLTHPFAGMPDFNGYDVRGIFMGDASGTLAYNTDLDYSVYEQDQFMLDDPLNGDGGGPDGYTRWHNASEFPNEGVLGFTPGGYGTKNYKPSATLCPYKYFTDNLGAQDDVWAHLNANAGEDGVFSSGQTNTRNYYLEFPLPTPGADFQYAVVASWVNATTHPANTIEAPAINVTVTDDIYYADPGDWGGDLILDIDVWGWTEQPSTIIIESTVLATNYVFDSADMTPIGGTENYSTYSVEFPADNVTGTLGNEFWVICEYGAYDYTCSITPPGGAPTDTLAAVFRYDLQVADESPCPDPAVTGIDPDYFLSGLDSCHVTITGVNLVDGPTLEARLVKDGESDIDGTDVQHVDNNTITADFDLTGATEGFWDVVVVNGCGKEATGEDLLEVYSCGSIGGFTSYYDVVIVSGWPYDLNGYVGGMAATQTGAPYVIGATRTNNVLGAMTVNASHGYTCQFLSSGSGVGSINRDIVCDSQNNVYFTDSANYNRLRYFPFNQSTGFGTVVVFGNIDSGWSIWRITIDKDDDPVVLGYSGGNMRVFHWDSGASDWDTTDVPGSVGSYSQVGDFDWNPLMEHYVFTRFISSYQCDLHAIDTDGDLVATVTDIFDGQYCTGLPGIYIDVSDPACNIVAWGSFSWFGTQPTPFARMTAVYADKVKTSINVGNITGNLNIAGPRGQVVEGSNHLILAAHYINVWARVPLPADW